MLRASVRTVPGVRCPVGNWGAGKNQNGRTASSNVRATQGGGEPRP